MPDEKTLQGNETSDPDGQITKETIVDADKPADTQQDKPENKETEPKPQGRAQTRIQQLVHERNALKDEVSVLKQGKKTPDTEDANNVLVEKLAYLEKEIKSLKDERVREEAKDAYDEQIDNFMTQKEKEGIQVSDEELDVICSMATIDKNGTADLEGAYKKFQGIVDNKRKPNATGVLTTAPSSMGIKHPEKKPSEMTESERRSWAESQLAGKV